MKDEDRSKEELLKIINGLRAKLEKFGGPKTRRRRSGEFLWKSMEMFRTLVDAIGEGVAIVDEDEKFYMVNPSGEGIFGVGAGALSGRSLTEFVNVDTYATIQKHNALRREGMTTTYDIDILRPDGNRRLLQVTASPMFDGDGGFMGTLGIFKDVTDQRRTEDELARLRDRFEEALAERTAPLEARIRRLEAEITSLKSR